MDCDFPAAHSADTTWFAVDKDGHVGIFETGEAGAMPLICAGGENFDTDPLQRALQVPNTKNEWDDEVPDWSRRLFVYEHGEDYENWVAGPYNRQGVPSNPVTIDQLPEPLRAELKQAQMPTVCFAEAATLQPVEHVKCAAWDPAYVTGDGKRIRPIPGFEEEYTQYHGEYLANEGDVPGDVEVEPPANPRPSTREKTPPAESASKKWWWPF